MKIYGTVGKLIDRYGTEVTVDNEKTKAFIHPIRNNNRYNETTKSKVKGTITSEIYLKKGKPETKLTCDKSVIQIADRKYIVRRYDIYRVGRYGVYAYGVLAPCGEVLEDEYESDTYTT